MFLRSARGDTPVHNVLDAHAYPLQGQVGGGWALEFESFWALCPKNSIIPGPNPLPLAQVMDMHASKTLCTGLYKS
jgi:hypothetical protein